LRVKPASELRAENRPAGSDLGGFEHDGVLEEPSMSNRTSMAQINAIGNRYRSGHSNRYIAKLLGVNRETVGKYVAAIKAAGTQNQPNPQTGFRQAKQLICHFSVAAKNINSAATNLPTTILNH
jgi:biotin operon repressor